MPGDEKYRAAYFSTQGSRSAEKTLRKDLLPGFDGKILSLDWGQSLLHSAVLSVNWPREM